jgi:antitoxin ChpS
MHKTNLRKVGGSIMLAVPPAILELLNFKVGSTVSMTVDGDRLVIGRPRYTLEELLAQCDASAEPDDEDAVWTTGTSTGGELL